VTQPTSAADPDHRSPLSRAAVVAAARNEIRAEGLDKLSFRRIAAVLGVTAPALYAHVQDKRDLLRAVADVEFAELLEAFERIDDEDPLERLRALARVYVERALAQPELFRTMFVFPPDIGLTAATGEELPMATQAFAYAAAPIGAAVADGRLRDDDPALITFVSWTAMHGLATVLTLGFEFDRSTRDLLIDRVLDAVFAGLAPPAA
jgi:AcrR family transcriptional regulator